MIRVKINWIFSSAETEPNAAPLRLQLGKRHIKILGVSLVR